MPKLVEVYQDAQGNTHKDLEAATLADLAALFENNMGTARAIWAVRSQVAALFEEHNKLSAQARAKEPPGPSYN